MKICLYLEFYHFWGGRLFKKIGTGLLSSYRNQVSTVQHLDLEYAEHWQDDCDILQINTPWLKSVWLMKRAKRLGKKVIVWSHVTAEDVVGVFRFSRWLAPLIKKYLTYAYGIADIVLCPSEYTRSLLMAYGLPAIKLVTHSNGVDLDLFYRDRSSGLACRKRYGLEGMVIGTVGLAIPRKGIDTFIKMADLLPECRLAWFGKIYSKVLVKALPSKLPSNSIFTGYVQDSLAAFNALDIFIFPSYEENEGMVLLEAAAIGLPIVVRDIPVYEGWLIDEVNCLKAKTDQEFFEQLVRLRADPELRERLGVAARRLAESKSKQALAQKLLAIYRQ